MLAVPLLIDRTLFGDLRIFLQEFFDQGAFFIGEVCGICGGRLEFKPSSTDHRS